MKKTIKNKILTYTAKKNISSEFYYTDTIGLKVFRRLEKTTKFVDKVFVSEIIEMPGDLYKLKIYGSKDDRADFMQAYKISKQSFYIFR